MLIERLRGVRDALGSDKRWYDRFDLTPVGFRASFMVAVLSLPAAAIIAEAVERERAIIVGTDAHDIHWPAFYFVMIGFLLAFPFVAAVATYLAGRRERFPAWVTVRHWTLFALVWATALPFALYLAGAIPYSVANIILFMGMFALLAADIRLAQKIGGFGLGAAVLIGSMITSAGLSLVLIGLMIYITSP